MLMAHWQLVAVLCCVRSFSAAAAALRAKASKDNVASYTFEQYINDFDRSYVKGTSEYKLRATLFHDSLIEIQAVNVRNQQEGRTWAAGVHPFMDWSEAERRTLHGYKPSSRRTHVPGMIQTGARAKMNMSYGDLADTFTTNVAPAIRQQADCGSCWAISAAEAVEAQLQMQGVDPSVKVSAQALVDCVPNPRHCGGSGGCDGATGELAYSFMRDYGIPLESDLPYDATTDACPHNLQGPWPAAQRVRVSGWDQLPSNSAEPLKHALVNEGPVVVAVDANNWFNYESGIFDGCSKDAILGHAVLVRGYGDDGGRKYWQIQNSWGSDWGEKGFIRITRHDEEDEWCGMDNKPKEGIGCDGGPSEVRVCGMCGLLYDPLVPQGVRLEQADAAGQMSGSSSAVSGTSETTSSGSFDFGSSNIMPQGDAIPSQPTSDMDTSDAEKMTDLSNHEIEDMKQLLSAS